MRRAERRHKAQTKTRRRIQLWKTVHPNADVGHKAKYWPVRCRCEWCVPTSTRTRENREALRYEEHADAA